MLLDGALKSFKKVSLCGGVFLFLLLWRILWDCSSTRSASDDVILCYEGWFCSFLGSLGDAWEEFCSSHIWSNVSVSVTIWLLYCLIDLRAELQPRLSFWIFWPVFDFIFLFNGIFGYRYFYWSFAFLEDLFVVYLEILTPLVYLGFEMLCFAALFSSN